MYGNVILDQEERHAAEIAAIRADILTRIEVNRVAKFKEIAGEEDLISLR